MRTKLTGGARTMSDCEFMIFCLRKAKSRLSGKYGDYFSLSSCVRSYGNVRFFEVNDCRWCDMAFDENLN